MSEHSSFATELPEVAEGFLSEIYGDMALSLADQPGSGFRLALERVEAGALKLDEMALAATSSFGYEPEEEFIVSIPRRGRLRLIQKGYDERFGPGEIVMLGRPGVESITEVADFRQHVVTLGAAALHAAAGLGPDDERPAFTGVTPITPARGRTWMRARDFVSSLIAADPSVARAPLVMGSTDRMMAALLLATFPNTLTERPLRADAVDAQPVGTLHRAIAFIEGNADLDIGIADIAAAARVSRRTIQLAFRRHLETTPTAYLRRVRLDHAHRELAVASPGDGLTVTEVAYRWGFSSPSRFAERYRAAFGYSPSETLHR